MSSLGAAQAASARVPVPVTSREILYSGAIVKVKVPIGAANGTYPEGDKNIPFLHFSYTIRGGRVNVFVHTDNSALRGRTITAEVSVLKKMLGDGREYLYIDLLPVASDTPVTHRLAVMSDIVGSWSNDDHLMFATPEPLFGLIIFVPPGAKLIPAGTVVRMVEPAARI
jgi:hypothetical protein